MGRMPKPKAKTIPMRAVDSEGKQYEVLVRIQPVSEEYPTLGEAGIIRVQGHGLSLSGSAAETALFKRGVKLADLFIEAQAVAFPSLFGQE